MSRRIAQVRYWLRAKLDDIAGRTAAERDTLKHAFETTAIDRDRLQSELDRLKAATETEHVIQTMNTGAGHIAICAPSRSEVNFGRAEIRRLVANLEPLYATKQFRNLVDEFFSGTELCLTPGANNLDHYSAYLMATLHSWAGDDRKSLAFCRDIVYPAPSPGTDFLPFDLRASSFSNVLRRSAPSGPVNSGIIVTSMMKSASGYLLDLAARTFSLNPVRISVGNGLYGVVVPNWLSFAVGSASITHEHFPASPSNLETLSNSKLSTLWVLARDPRDAAYSLLMMRDEWAGIPCADGNMLFRCLDLGDQPFERATMLLSNWLLDWINASTSLVSPRIQILSYDDLVSDPRASVEKLYGATLPPPMLTAFTGFLSDWQEGAIYRRHFRAGTGGEWRKKYGTNERQRAWNAINPSVRNLLGLRP